MHLNKNNRFMKYHSEVDKEKKEDTRAYIELDRLGRVVCINSVLADLLSKTDAEVVGEYLNNVIRPVSGNTKAFHYVWHDIRRGKLQESNFTLTSKDKKETQLKFEIQTDTNIYGEVNRIIMVSEDTSHIGKGKNNTDIGVDKEEITGMMTSLKSKQNEMISRMQNSRNVQRELANNMQNLLNTTLGFTSF